MFDVSIIIVNYNSFTYLKECVKSILQFTNGISYEIIIVDNDSDEGDIKNVIGIYKDIKLIQNSRNLGFAAANNQGIQIAIGKYVLFLNNDTLLIDNTIKSVFDFVESNNNKIFAGIQLLNTDNTKQESVVEFPSVWNAFTENFFIYKLFQNSKWLNKYYQNNLNFTEPVEVDVIRGAFMFCPKNEIDNLNGFDDRFFFYSEETDLCYRFKKSGGKIFFLPNLKIIHHGGASADANLWFKYKNQTVGKIQYYQKHFSGINFFLVIFLHWTGLLARSIIYSIGGLLTINKNLLLKGYYFFKQIFVYPQNKFAKQ